ncbi:MAG: hypothetical protein HYS58_01725 [Elusimicrobia bacterium]|nr:hypothetical protein [Elusimicrobiota bacterium]
MRIFRVYFSEQDSLNLAGREAPKQLKEDLNFMQWIVNKPWGHEYLMYTNPFTEVWSLHVQGNAITSVHTHPNKKTALILLEGEALFSTLNTSIPLKPLDSVMIDAGVFHSTRALSPTGAVVIEVESPPIKYDLIRLKDQYGREGKFYEGVDQMSQNSNGCVRFVELGVPSFVQKKHYNSLISIKRISNGYSQEDRRQLEDQDLIAILEGNIHSRKGQLLHSVVDVVKRSNFMESIESHVFNNLTLFLIKSQEPGA